MNIVYTSNSIIPSGRANSIHIMKMCQAFARNGHEVTLLVTDKKERKMPEDIFKFYGVEPVFRVQRLRWHGWKGGANIFAFASAMAAKELKADLVYGRYLAGCLFSAMLGLSVIYEIHDPSAQHRMLFQRFLFRQLLRRRELRKIVVISQALKDHMVKTLNVDAARVLVAHDAADLPTHENPRYSGDSDRLQIGYVGQLYPGKGMEIIAVLVTKCRSADFHVIGGTEKDLAFWKKKLSAEKNIFFHGFLPPSQLEAHRETFDIVLAPYQKRVTLWGTGDISRWMSPLKIFEYMAAKKPMIVSDLPVLREVLNDSNAVLVDPEDVEGWVAAIDNLKDPTTREKLAEKAYKDFFSRHTWTQRADLVLRNIDGRIKVQFIISVLSSGGAEMVVRTLANALDKSQYDVGLITFVRQETAGLLDPAVRHISFDKKSRWNFFRLVPALRKKVKEIRPDIVISFLNYPNILTFFSGLGRRKYKWVACVRNNPLKMHAYSRYGLVEKVLLKFIYRHADLVTTNSKNIQTIIQRNFYVDPKKTRNIYNPVDIKRVSRLAGETVSHRFFAGDSEVILSVGRLTQQKRFDRLIRAFAKVHEKRPATRLLILGKGEKEGELRTLITSLNIAESVDMPGYQTNPYAWMRRSALVALSSDYEGFPNVVLESMACGTPVISTNCPYGPSEIIRSGENGLLASLDEGASLAAGILRLLEDKTLREKVSKNGAIEVKRFDVSDILPQYEEIFSNLGGRH